MSRQGKRMRTDASADTNSEPSNKFAQVLNIEEYRMSDMPDCEVYYMPSFIQENVSREWYKELLDLDSWYQPKLKVFGREVTQSRKIAAYSTDPSLVLKYSGQTVDMKYEYPPVLRDIQDQVEKRLGVTFNHVMMNLYEDGTVYIGNHRDNIENKVIASVSLGAERTFIMTHDSKRKKGNDDASSEVPKKSKGKRSRDEDEDDESVDADTLDRSGSSLSVARKSWVLQSGSLVVMQGETQKYWKHGIPKEPKVRDGRISLTFRQLATS